MGQLYQATLNNPRNVGPTFFVGNTDPAIASAAFVRAASPWIQTENDAAPWGQALAFKIRDADDAGWITVASLAGGDPGGGSESPVADGVISGGQVVHKTGLTYTVSATVYAIAGEIYSAPETDVTLAVADPTNPRIDLIVATTSNTISTVTGTAAATPIEPDVDEETEVSLAFALVGAGATTPTGVVVTDIWQEGAEWTDASSSGNIVLESLNNPFAGTKSIEATNAVANNVLTFTAPGPVDINNEALLVFRLRSKAAWPSTKYLRVFFRSAGARVGVARQVRDGTYQFVSATTGSYQQIAIPISDFKIPVGTTIADLRIEVLGSGAAIGFYLDSIILQRGIAQGVGSKLAFRGSWSSSTAYLANDLVLDSGIPYVALQSSTNQDPSSSPTYWTALAPGLAPLAAPALTGAATLDGDAIATETYVDALIASLTSGAPALLDTFAELAAAIEDDENFGASVLASLTSLDSRVDALEAAGSPAPDTADYLVKTANAGLSAERVVTDTTTIEVDWGTAGQAKFQVKADAPLPGAPTVATAAEASNDTKVASTAYVERAVLHRADYFEFALSDETTSITTGTAKLTWRAPFAFTVTGVRASLSTASSSGIPTVDINEAGVSILSTKLTIDANEKTSVTAATAAVVSDATIADDAEITFDIDVAGTGAKGLKVKIYYTRS